MRPRRFLHPLGRRRPAMDSPEPGLLCRLRGRLARLAPWLRHGFSCPGAPGLKRRLLAAGLSCCTVLALYAANSLRDPPPVWGRGNDGGDEAVTVLMWWVPFGRNQPLDGCERRFGIRACNLTTDRGRQLEAQAVVFHHRNLMSSGLQNLPRVRPPEQRWVWMNSESPSHTRGLQDLGGIFNWTMSYKVDSDVFVPYGYLRPSQTPALHLPMPRKTKLVAWAISNWKEEQARVRYYHQLKDHLPIDIYGAHGLKLKDNSVVKTVSEYKFYLAFENSQHPDYITEKLWRNAFTSWAVPIVLGPARSNYELFIPPDSFIHIDDFASPRHLALYLKFLDKNKSRYQRYFAWRKRYDVQVLLFWVEHGCRVCDAVRAAGKQPKTIQNLANWFES
ncbi:alpha-(1,3)-fucosyltransferase 4 [Podarcis raffonei]|uniref:alpha-(1,3)-fucosyltransferase 4 n=1 Tax=Podarcis raffonei TaxID=65483 RepID=UPI0023298DD1|nr:alpha-(1,3)-fucosyltransferase 4 [Podarcis raffonei]